VTSNCIVPVADAYRDRIFTTALPGIRAFCTFRSAAFGCKDFSSVIALAKNANRLLQSTKVQCPAVQSRSALDDGTQLLDLVEKGALTRVVVMAGCDGATESGNTTERWHLDYPRTHSFSRQAAQSTYLQAAAWDNRGSSEVLDAGQCNDCYS